MPTRILKINNSITKDWDFERFLEDNDYEFFVEISNDDNRNPYRKTYNVKSNDGFSIELLFKMNEENIFMLDSFRKAEDMSYETAMEAVLYGVAKTKDSIMIHHGNNNYKN